LLLEGQQYQIPARLTEEDNFLYELTVACNSMKYCYNAAADICTLIPTESVGRALRSLPDSLVFSRIFYISIEHLKTYILNL
jgi:hypothetical protein